MRALQTAAEGVPPLPGGDVDAVVDASAAAPYAAHRPWRSRLLPGVAALAAAAAAAVVGFGSLSHVDPEGGRSPSGDLVSFPEGDAVQLLLAHERG